MSVPPYPEHADYEHLNKCHRCGHKYSNDDGECPNCNKRPICKECKEGEVMQMTLTKRDYHNGVWFIVQDSKDNDEWYRCDNCQAEYSEEEIKGLLLAK